MTNPWLSPLKHITVLSAMWQVTPSWFQSRPRPSLTDLPATNESWLSLSTCGWPSTPSWTNPGSPTPFCLGAGMPPAAHRTFVAGVLSAWISIPHVTFPLLFWNWIDLEMGAAPAAEARAAIPTATVETARAANRFMLSPRARLPRLRLRLQFGLHRSLWTTPQLVDYTAACGLHRSLICRGRGPRRYRRRRRLSRSIPRPAHRVRPLERLGG